MAIDRKLNLPVRYRYCGFDVCSYYGLVAMRHLHRPVIRHLTTDIPGVARVGSR
jgi:hypothetical protein